MEKLKKKEEKSKKSELKRFIIDLILLSIRVDVIRSGRKEQVVKMRLRLQVRGLN